MSRSCIWRCGNIASYQSPQYGITVCSNDCLENYINLKASPTWENIWYIHASLMRQYFIERMNHDKYHKELMNEIFVMEDYIVQELPGYTLGIQRNDQRIIQHMEDILDRKADSNSSVFLVLSTYEENLMESYGKKTIQEMQCITQDREHDMIFDDIIRIVSQLKKPALLGKSDPPLRMMHPQSGRRQLKTT